MEISCFRYLLILYVIFVVSKYSSNAKLLFLSSIFLYSDKDIKVSSELYILEGIRKNLFLCSV